MALVCDLCGRGPLVGYNVSHAHNKTKKRQKPNLRTVRLKHSGTSTLTVRICADDLKELKRRGFILRWKDLPENQVTKEEVQAAAPTAEERKPKKETPKVKKAKAEAKDKVETVEKATSKTAKAAKKTAKAEKTEANEDANSEE